MATEHEVDHALLARYTDGLCDAHVRSQQTMRAYLEEMASYGRPWGLNNEVGQAIDMCFGAIQQAYTQCQQENLEDYRLYPEGLRRMGATHKSSEDSVIAQIDESFEGKYGTSAS